MTATCHEKELQELPYLCETEDEVSSSSCMRSDIPGKCFQPGLYLANSTVSVTADGTNTAPTTALPI